MDIFEEIFSSVRSRWIDCSPVGCEQRENDSHNMLLVIIIKGTNLEEFCLLTGCRNIRSRKIKFQM